VRKVSRAVCSREMSSPLRRPCVVGYQRQPHEMECKVQPLSGRPEGCSSDVDTDSYLTADDDDHVLNANVPSVQLHPFHESSRQRDSSEFESYSSSSSSSSLEEDDSLAGEKVTADHPRLESCHSDPEKRRKSYQFAVSNCGNLIPDTNDDGDMVCDLDPAEFHHSHCRTSQDDSESGGLVELLYDLDPVEFNHPPLQPTSTEAEQCTTVEGEDSDDEERQRQCCRGQSDVCSIERHESVIEGSALSTIVIPSPTDKTCCIDIDHREWVVHQCTVRAAVHLSQLLSVLRTDRSSRVMSSDDETLINSSSRVALPIIEAVVSETTELIRATLVDSSVLWESVMFDDNFNLSTSPGKEFHYEARTPSPDYDGSVLSSSCSEVGVDDNDDAVHPRTEGSPTPDYDSDVEFHVDDVDEYAKSPPLAGMCAGEIAASRDNSIEAIKSVKEHEGNVTEPLTGRGLQRYLWPDHHTALSMAPAQTSGEIESTREYVQEASSPVSELPQFSDHRIDSFRREKGITEMETAPAVLSQNNTTASLWQSRSTSAISLPADQRTLNSTLGRRSYKKMHTGKRLADLYILCCSLFIWLLLAM